MKCHTRNIRRLHLPPSNIQHETAGSLTVLESISHTGYLGGAGHIWSSPSLEEKVRVLFDRMLAWNFGGRRGGHYGSALVFDSTLPWPVTGGAEALVPGFSRAMNRSGRYFPIPTRFSQSL